MTPVLILEYALFALGLYGVTRLLPRAHGFVRGERRQPGQSDVPLPHLAERLQPVGPALKVRVVGDTGPGDHGTAFVIEGVCPGLTLHRERGPEWLVEGVPTGDPDFDRTFLVRGDLVLVLALLDGKTRRLLERLAGTMEPGAAVVERGVLTVVIGLGHRVDPDAVRRRGQEAVALAQRLLQPPDAAERLAENARHDPVPGVRLRAALAMGPPGKDLLLPLVRDGGIDETTAAAAIEALGTAAPLDAVLEVLRRALGPRPMDEVVDVQAARACVAVLRALGCEYTISRLERVLLTVPPLADDAARALARIGGAAAQEALIAGLTSVRSECRMAVVPVLAEVGTAAAVAPLMEAEGRGGDLRWRARWAITQIQSRLTGEAGAVSLAGTDSGAVSLAPDAGGAVSLPPDPAKD